DLRMTSLALLAIAGFVLTTVCANVASLLLTRGTSRAREIAVRAAIGGTPGRIMRQLLTESLMLAIAGGVGGWALAEALVRAAAAAPARTPAATLPPAIVLNLDGRLAMISAAIATATGLLFGAAPAYRATRISTAEALGTGGRAVSRPTHGLGGTLAIVEVAVAVVLVCSATLLVRTVRSLHDVDTGFIA